MAGVSQKSLRELEDFYVEFHVFFLCVGDGGFHRLTNGTHDGGVSQKSLRELEDFLV